MAAGNLVARVENHMHRLWIDGLYIDPRAAMPVYADETLENGHWATWAEHQTRLLQEKPKFTQTLDRDTVLAFLQRSQASLEAFRERCPDTEQRALWMACFDAEKNGGPLPNEVPENFAALKDEFYPLLEEKNSPFDDCSIEERTSWSELYAWEENEARLTVVEDAINNRTNSPDIQASEIYEALYRMNGRVWKVPNQTKRRTWQIRRNTLNAMHLLNLRPESGKADRLARLILQSNHRLPVAEDGAEKRLLACDFNALLGEYLANGNGADLSQIVRQRAEIRVTMTHRALSTAEFVLGSLVSLIYNPVAIFVSCCVNFFVLQHLIRHTIPYYAEIVGNVLLDNIGIPLAEIAPTWAAQSVNFIAPYALMIWNYQLTFFCIGFALRTVVQWSGYDNVATRGLTLIGHGLELPIRYLIWKVVLVVKSVISISNAWDYVGRRARVTGRFVQNQGRLLHAEQILNHYIHDVAVAPYQTAEV